MKYVVLLVLTDNGGSSNTKSGGSVGYYNTPVYGSAQLSSGTDGAHGTDGPGGHPMGPNIEPLTIAPEYPRWAR